MVHKLLKLSRKYLRKVTSTFLALYLIFSPLFAFPADLFASTPSTNTNNKSNGWAHYEVIDVTETSATVQFKSTRTFLSCFEYRGNGQPPTSTPHPYNPGDGPDGKWPHTCVNNSTATVTILGAEYVEIRMIFGAENDERFSWEQINLLPAAPTLLSPVSSIAFKTSQLPQTQTWTSVTGAVKYIYSSYSEDPQLNPFAVPAFTTEIVSPTRQIGVGANEGKFWWRVKAVNADNLESAWSDAWFVYIDNTKPEIEILNPASANDVLSAPVAVRATDNLRLKQVTANLYNADTDVLVKSCSQNVSALDVVEFELTCDVGSLPTGVYYVKTNARDLTDTLSTTLQRNFIIDKDYPVISEARMYVNGVPSWLTKSGDTVRIEADVVDQYSPIDKVQIWVREWPYNPAQNQLTSGLMTHVSGDTWEFTFVVPTAYQSGDPLNEAFEGNYFNFRPYDILGNSLIGWRHNYTIDNTAPDAPVPLSPADGAFIKPIAFNQTWTPIADAVEYQYQSCNVDPGDLGDPCPSVKFTSTHTGTTKNVGAGQPNSHFWWRVRAKDAAGNWSEFGPAFELYIDGTAPTTPKWVNMPRITANGDLLHVDPVRRLEMEFAESSDSYGVAYYEYSFVRRDLDGNFQSAGSNVNMNTYMGGVTCLSGVCTWVPDFQLNNQWVFRMRAVDNAANKGAWSNWNDASDAEFMSFDFSYQDMVDGTGIFARSDFDTDLGNTSYVLREAIAPESNITSTDEITNNPSVSIVYEAQDGESELKKVELWYSYNGSPYTLRTTALTNSTSGSFNFSLADGDGDYCFYTIAEDVADDGILDAGLGNRETVPADPCELEIRLDTQLPVVGPVGVLIDFLGAYVNGSTGFVLGASVSDSGVGLDSATCEVTIDGLTWTPGSILLGNCYTTIPSLPDAQDLFINVRIKDLAGNAAAGVQIERTSDAALPTTSVDIVENFYGPNTFNLPTTTIVGTADDSVSGISDVKLTIQRSSDSRYYVSGFWLPVSSHLLGQTPSFVPTTSAGTVDWTYAGGFGKANGVTYTVRAYARDNVNLITYGSPSLDSFTWDSQAPVNPTVAYPDYTNNSNVAVTWSGATDALSGVDGFYYSFSASPETPAQNPLYWLEETETSATESLAEGEWYFNIITVDNVGNVSNVSTYGPIIVDLTDPVVDVLSHTEGELVSGVQTVEVEVVDDNLLRYYFVILNSSNTVVTGPGTVNHDGPTVTPSLSWDTTLLPDGEYRIRIEARDKANNKGSQSVKTIKVVVDNTPGVSTMASPIDDAVTSSPIAIVGQSTDAHGIDFVELSYKVAGSLDPWTLITTIDNPSDDSPFDWSYDWTPSADGLYDIKASSTDVLGNVENSAYAMNVKYDTTAPTITLLGNNPVTLTEGDVYTDAGAQATDNLDGDMTGNIIVDNPVDANIPGTYTVTYNVSDSAGNAATPVTRTVVVEEAPEEPEGEVLGEQDNTSGNAPFQTQALQNEEEGNNEEDGEVLGLVCDVRQNMTGYVYIDRNGNGIRDNGDEGLEGVRVRIIYLDNGEEVVVDTLRTDSNGRWKTEVCPGEYEVRIDEETLPNGVELEGEDTLGVTVGDDSGEHNINFTLTEGSDESGFDFRWILLAIVVGGLLLLGWRKYVASKNTPVGYSA